MHRRVSTWYIRPEWKVNIWVYLDSQLTYAGPINNFLPLDTNPSTR